jgi:DNA-binding CsgD family transcriptional regulator
MTVSRAPGTPSEATTLVLSESGEVVAAPDGALRWLETMRRGDALDRVGMLLASVAARIRRPGHTDQGRAAVRVRMRSSGGAWTTLLAEPLAGYGETRGISVVVMPTDSAQLFPLLVAAYGLSGRERDLVHGVLDGLDTKAIAGRLSISVNTVQDHLKSVFVQDHLKSVFDKTGVRSRRELAFVFSREPKAG